MALGLLYKSNMCCHLLTLVRNVCGRFGKEERVVKCIFDVIDSYAKISGQTKQIFGRNTETETRPPRKAEISAKTEIACFGNKKTVLAVDFILKCAAEIDRLGRK